MKKKMLFILLAVLCALMLVSCLGEEDPEHTHTEVEIPAVSATCTESGLTAGKKCSECGEITVAQETVEALGHDLDNSGICSRGDYTPTVGLEYKLNDDGESYSVSGTGTATETDIIIGNVYNGKPVTSIGSSAFSRCTSLTRITIPDRVTSIGEWTFSNCRSLTSVTFGENSQLTSIGERAFYNCMSLTSIEIPDSVTSISEHAFLGCNSLTSITIPDSVTNIGRSAFYNCTNLESITVSEGNTVYHSAGNCLIETASKTLILGCKNSVIPTDGSVTSIGDDAFRYCTSLTSIEIPDSVTSIGYHAFSNCRSLTRITIPDSVTSIGNWAFDGCSSLTSIMIPDSVTSIGDDAFSYCSSLESITVANGNTTYHSAGNCLIETASKTLILGCKNSVVPTDGSVTSIGSYAFDGCTSLTSITIPDSVKSIDIQAFSYCTSLTDIYFGGTKAEWNAIGKGSSWNYNTGNYTIYCTDGEIAK